MEVGLYDVADALSGMIEANKLSLKEIALYSGLTMEQVAELEQEFTS